MAIGLSGVPWLIPYWMSGGLPPKHQQKVCLLGIVSPVSVDVCNYLIFIWNQKVYQGIIKNLVLFGAGHALPLQTV